MCSEQKIAGNQLPYFLVIWTDHAILSKEKPSLSVWSGVIHQAYDFQHTYAAKSDSPSFAVWV